MSTFSRADALNIKSVQLNDVVNSTLDLMRFDKRMKSSIEIGVALDPCLPKTMIDEGQISQVFINIILNAFDAMPDGGKLTVATHQGTDEQGHKAVMIEFADTGIGMAKHEIEKIFDPFYTTKEAGKGTGLGLSVSYNIVKQFKGDIKVESESGKGTAFTIILPLENA
jgi:signal transduction histidine kinase